MLYTPMLYTPMLYTIIITWEGSEYTEDIFRSILERERKPILRIRKTSPQLGKRVQLIDWARDVSNKLQLNPNTFHLAVKLIDIFMDGHNIEVSPGLRLLTENLTK